MVCGVKASHAGEEMEWAPRDGRCWMWRAVSGEGGDAALAAVGPCPSAFASQHDHSRIP